VRSRSLLLGQCFTSVCTQSPQVLNAGLSHVPPGEDFDKAVQEAGKRNAVELPPLQTFTRQVGSPFSGTSLVGSVPGLLPMGDLHWGPVIAGTG
jgi:hypothetical protein